MIEPIELICTHSAKLIAVFKYWLLITSSFFSSRTNANQLEILFQTTID